MEKDSIIDFIIEDKLFSKLVSGCAVDFSRSHPFYRDQDDIILKKSLVALYSLEYTIGLKEENQQEYIMYLRNYAALIIPLLIRYGDVWMIYKIAKIGAISKEKIDAYIDLANELSKIEMVTILLDHKNKTWGVNYQVSLEIDGKPKCDWETMENLDGTLTVKKYLGKDEVVTIPFKIEDRQVSQIEGDLWSLHVSIFFPNKDHVKSVIIEDGIKRIGYGAFLECTKIESIQIPPSVEIVDFYAFAGCHRLSIITIPDGAWIGPAAFKDCRNLTSINIPEGVETIGDSTFSQCSKLECVQITNGVKEIGRLAFANCSSLKSIVIPESVQFINEGSFKNCSSLSSVLIPNSVKEIESSVFENCKNLVSINIPEGVESIAKFAFRGCTSLKSVVVPESVDELDRYAFACCKNLAVHTSKKLHYVGDWGFSELLDGTLRIDEYYCTKTNVTVPAFIGDKKVSSTADRIFEQMHPPNSVVTVAIEEGIEEIFPYTFDNCFQLITVQIPGTVKIINEFTFSSLINLESVVFHEGVEEICDTAFYNCIKLSKVVIPASVKYIQRDPLSYECDNLVIHAPKGSYAIEYAKENNIEYLET